jgi:aldose 1-epimerase
MTGKRIEKTNFGRTPDGQQAELYTVRNSHGVVAKITNYGGILTELWMPDRHGETANVVLGFGSLDGYLAGHPYFGATVGRYANRIAKGHFSIDGHSYHVPVNNGPNSLHGGLIGFDKRLWHASALEEDDGATVALSYVSPNGEQGYPGTLTVRATYTLSDDNTIRLAYDAVTDAPTVLNLTNHSYFNLGGEASGNTILDHILTIDADHYTPVDDTAIPTGVIAPVAGTVFDFRHPTAIGLRLAKVPGPPPGGYDHNYVLNHAAGALGACARLHDPRSGRTLKIETTQPGVQFYTGNFLDGTLVGVGGKRYVQHYACCLETQHFPDSPNHPDFPSTVLRPGERYKQLTTWRLSAD